MDNGTLLLQHLRQIRHSKVLKAVSAFVCQLIGEACSGGKLPVISLQCLLAEVHALLSDPASLPCTIALHPARMHHIATCSLLYSTILDSPVLFCTILHHTHITALLHHAACCLIPCSSVM